MGETGSWRYESLPNVLLDMEGGLSLQPDNVDAEDDSKRSHFEQEYNWRIDHDTQDFVIRITRKPEAAWNGHTINVAVKIEGGLTEQPDGSVVFDGGVGHGDGNGVCSFGLSFKISQESISEGLVEPEEESPTECDACKDYIQRGLHYHCTRCKVPCTRCDFNHPATHPVEEYCDSPQQAWTEIPQEGGEAYWDPNPQHPSMIPQQCVDYGRELLEGRILTQLSRQWQTHMDSRNQSIREYNRSLELLSAEHCDGTCWPRKSCSYCKLFYRHKH